MDTFVTYCTSNEGSSTAIRKLSAQNLNYGAERTVSRTKRGTPHHFVMIRVATLALAAIGLSLQGFLQLAEPRIATL